MNAEKYCWRNLLQIAFHLVMLLELIEGCLECWLGLFQFVGLLGKLPDFLGWRFESLLETAEKYCWRNLLQFAFRLVRWLELAGSCLECWLGLFQFVGLLGNLTDFLGWRFESLLKNAEKYCWRNLL